MWATLVSLSGRMSKRFAGKSLAKITFCQEHCRSVCVIVEQLERDVVLNAIMISKYRRVCLIHWWRFPNK